MEQTAQDIGLGYVISETDKRLGRFTEQLLTSSNFSLQACLTF